jgi:hypothetical protein
MYSIQQLAITNQNIDENNKFQTYEQNKQVAYLKPKQRSHTPSKRQFYRNHYGEDDSVNFEHTDFFQARRKTGTRTSQEH